MLLVLKSLVIFYDRSVLQRVTSRYDGIVARPTFFHSSGELVLFLLSRTNFPPYDSVDLLEKCPKKPRVVVIKTDLTGLNY